MGIKGSVLAQRTYARCKKNIYEQHRWKPHMLSVPEQKAFRIACRLRPSSHSWVQFPWNLRGISKVCAKCFGWRAVPTSHVPVPHPEHLTVELTVAVYSKFGTLLTHKRTQVPGDASKSFLQCVEKTTEANIGCHNTCCINNLIQSFKTSKSQCSTYKVKLSTEHVVKAYWEWRYNATHTWPSAVPSN
jgi:hypothetical protein